MTKSEKKSTLALYILCTFANMSYITIVSLAYILNSYSNESPATVTLLLTIPSLVGLAVSFIIGPVSMKISVKKLLIISYSILIAAAAIYFVVGSGSLPMLLLAAVLCGIGQGSYGTLHNTLVAERVVPERRANVMAVVNALVYGGAIFYNIVGGKIAAIGGGANWNRAYLLAFILIPTTILFAILCPSKPDKESVDEAPTDSPAASVTENIPVSGPKLSPFVIGICVLFGVNMVFEYCTGLNMSNYFVNLLQLGDASLAGVVMSAGTAGVFVSGILYKYYSRPLKDWVAVVGLIGYGVGSILIALIPNVALFIACQFLMGFSAGALTPYIAASVSINTQPKYIPIAMSLFAGLMNGFMFLAQYIIDALAKIGVDPSNTVAYAGNKFFVCGIGLFACAVVAIFMYPLRNKKLAAQKQAQ